MKVVERYESNGVTPAASSYDEGTVLDGAATTARRMWWRNASTASEVLAACQMRRMAAAASADGITYLQIAADVPLSAPGASSLALAAGSELEVGLYKYAITFLTANGETIAGAEASITTTGGNERVQLTAIPTGPSGTTARRIYRTAVGGTQKKLVAELGNNSAIEYLDQVPDASLGANTPTLNASGSAGAWQTAPIAIGDMAVGDFAGCWMRFNVPAGITQTGNPRRAYVRFEEAAA